jgi:hypothetical protein
MACNKSSEQRDAEMAHNDPDRSVATPSDESMAPAAGIRGAADRIADARCEREQNCGNIGANEAYSSTQDCLTRVRNEWRDDLNARECPGGVNQPQLDECLVKVRTESCGSPFGALARLTECTSAQICIEEPRE